MDNNETVTLSWRIYKVDGTQKNAIGIKNAIVIPIKTNHDHFNKETAWARKLCPPYAC